MAMKHLNLLASIATMAAAGCAISEAELATHLAETEKCKRDLEISRRERTGREGDLDLRNRQLSEKVRTLEEHQRAFAKAFKGDEKHLRRLFTSISGATERQEEFRAVTARLATRIARKEARVLVERSMVVVRLPTAALFKGGATIQAAEDDLVSDVGRALRDLPNRSFLIADHGGIGAPRNERGNRAVTSFELSAARAATIASSLRGRGIAPDRLAIAGHSEFDALLGDAHEPRIDIWLLPRASELIPID